jgi:hypothetical protein
MPQRTLTSLIENTTERSRLKITLQRLNDRKETINMTYAILHLLIRGLNQLTASARESDSGYSSRMWRRH